MFRAQHCVLGRLSSHSLREFGSFRRRLQRVGNLQGKLAPRAALRRRPGCAVIVAAVACAVVVVAAAVCSGWMGQRRCL
jgi:hypothetical protein